MKFKEILKNEKVLKVIEELKYEEPTEIQEGIIPLILDGNDVLGQSKTGTGKTLAFVTPMLEKIEENQELQTLILAPTRELAIQIARETELLSKYTKINVTCVYGNSSIEDQIRALKKGPEIVVGTPGRVKDLIKRGKLKLQEIKYFVLDEADEMLSMGFQEELEFIFEKTSTDKQVLLFSATMPKVVLNIAKKYMSSKYKTVLVTNQEKTADQIEQYYYVITDATRIEAMCRVLDYYLAEKVIIFCRTKRNADELLSKLSERNYNVDIIHGDITQTQRIATLDRFKAGQFNYLIATDVAARGIHVEDIEIVVNYNLPESNEAYVHRIGRTGRANKSGVSITFVKSNEMKNLNGIEKYINKKIIEKELPTMNDIIPNRLDLLKAEIQKLKDKEDNITYFEDIIENLTTEEKNKILNELLNKELMNKLGSDFSIDIEKAMKGKDRKRVNNKDEIRIFLTIGKIDNIEKRDFLLFLEKTAKVQEGTFSKVEIMTKFTFMNVKKDQYDKVLDSCNNRKYNGRIIKIEKAKKQ